MSNALLALSLHNNNNNTTSHAKFIFYFFLQCQPRRSCCCHIFFLSCTAFDFYFWISEREKNQEMWMCKETFSLFLFSSFLIFYSQESSAKLSFLFCPDSLLRAYFFLYSFIYTAVKCIWKKEEEKNKKICGVRKRK